MTGVEDLPKGVEILKFFFLHSDVYLLTSVRQKAQKRVFCWLSSNSVLENTCLNTLLEYLEQFRMFSTANLR